MDISISAKLQITAFLQNLAIYQELFFISSKIYKEANLQLFLNLKAYQILRSQFEFLRVFLMKMTHWFPNVWWLKETAILRMNKWPSNKVFEVQQLNLEITAAIRVDI